jgi:hypothetical protein
MTMASDDGSDDETHASEASPTKESNNDNISMDLDKEEVTQSIGKEEETKAVVSFTKQETVSRLSSPVFTPADSAMETTSQDEEEEKSLQESQDDEVKNEPKTSNATGGTTKPSPKASSPSSTASPVEIKNKTSLKKKKPVKKKKTVSIKAAKKPLVKKKNARKLPLTRNKKKKNARETFLSASANLLYSWESLMLGRELGSAALNEVLETLHPLHESPRLTSLQTLQIVHSLQPTTIVPPDPSPLHKVIQTVRKSECNDKCDYNCILTNTLFFNRIDWKIASCIVWTKTRTRMRIFR